MPGNPVLGDVVKSMLEIPSPVRTRFLTLEIALILNSLFLLLLTWIVHGFGRFGKSNRCRGEGLCLLSCDLPQQQRWWAAGREVLRRPQRKPQLSLLFITTTPGKEPSCPNTQVLQLSWDLQEQCCLLSADPLTKSETLVWCVICSRHLPILAKLYLKGLRNLLTHFIEGNAFIKEPKPHHWVNYLSISYMRL